MTETTRPRGLEEGTLHVRAAVMYLNRPCSGQQHNKPPRG